MLVYAYRVDSVRTTNLLPQITISDSNKPVSTEPAFANLIS